MRIVTITAACAAMLLQFRVFAQTGTVDDAALSPLGAVNLTALSNAGDFRFLASFDETTIESFLTEDSREFRNAVYVTGKEKASFQSSGSQNNKILRSLMPKGCVGSAECGTQLLTDFDSPEITESGFNIVEGVTDTNLWLTYSFRFADNFKPVLGGILPGMCSGSCMTDCGVPMTDESGWSARLGWNENGELKVHLFHMDKVSNCGDDIGLRYADNFQIPKIIPGQWHTMEMNVVLNQGGDRNGLLTVYLDQRKALSLSNVGYTTKDETHFISRLYLSMFFGGDEDRHASSTDTFLDLDAILVSEVRLLRDLPPPESQSITVEVSIAAASAAIMVVLGIGACACKRDKSSQETNRRTLVQRVRGGVPSASSVKNRVASTALYAVHGLAGVSRRWRREKAPLGYGTPPPRNRKSKDNTHFPSRFATMTDGARLTQTGTGSTSDLPSSAASSSGSLANQGAEGAQGGKPVKNKALAKWFPGKSRGKLRPDGVVQFYTKSFKAGSGADENAPKTAQQGQKKGKRAKKKQKALADSKLGAGRSAILSGTISGCQCGEDKLVSVKLDDLSWVDAVKLCQGYSILAQGTREELVERIKEYSKEHFGMTSTYACRKCMTSISPTM